MKIVVLDDSLHMLMVIQSILTSADHEVLTAREIRKAIDYAFTECPDWILVDEELPPIRQGCPPFKGTMVIRSLRRMGVTSRIASISSNDRYKDDALQAGADIFIHKDRNAEIPEILESFGTSPPTGYPVCKTR